MCLLQLLLTTLPGMSLILAYFWL